MLPVLFSDFFRAGDMLIYFDLAFPFIFRQSTVLLKNRSQKFGDSKNIALYVLSLQQKKSGEDESASSPPEVYSVKY